MPVSCGASVTWTVTWTVENLQWHIVLQLLHQFNQTLLIQQVQGSGIHVSHLHLMGMLVVPLMTDILQNLQDSFSANFGSVNDWMIVPASMSTVTHSGPDPKPTLTLTAPLDWSKIKSLSYITHTHAHKVAYLCGFCAMMHRSAVPRETLYRRSAAAPFCTCPVGPSPAFWKRKDKISSSGGNIFIPNSSPLRLGCWIAPRPPVPMNSSSFSHWEFPVMNLRGGYALPGKCCD